MIRWYWITIVFLSALCVSFFIPYDTLSPLATAVVVATVGIGVGCGVVKLERFVEGDEN